MSELTIEQKQEELVTLQANIQLHLLGKIECGVNPEKSEKSELQACINQYNQLMEVWARATEAANGIKSPQREMVQEVQCPACLDTFEIE